MKNNPWRILYVTVSATALVFLDNTVMPVALPTLQREFGFQEETLSWIVNAYLLSLMSLLLIGGRLSDLFGKRKLYHWGMAIFVLGSIVGAASFSQGTLIMGRILQGAGGAMLVPTNTALLISTFPENKRAKAIGINVGISSFFMILGPVVGGFLTEFVSWRAIFGLNIPLALFGFIMSFWLIPKNTRKQESFHFLGALSLMAAVTFLVVGLMQANSWGWDSPITLALIFLSPLLFAWFVWMTLRVKDPLIDLKVFQNPAFTLASVTLFLTQIIVTVTVLWAIYFQNELHYSPFETGIVILSAALPVIFVAPIGGILADRFGSKFPILIGFVLLIFSLSWFLSFSETTQIMLFYPGILTFGCGIPLIMSPSIALGLSKVSTVKLGAASGIIIGIRQLASTIGISVMTAIFYGTMKVTQSSEDGFAAISLVAGLMALIGLIFVIFFLKKKHSNARLAP